MRLVNTATLQLVEFVGSPPPYAILSHTWAEDELCFADFRDTSLRVTRKGFRKISATCDRAQQDGLGFVWVDTCCIDKLSSAELSEAINTMFRWYREAKTCYAYLEDVSSFAVSDLTRPDSPFVRSRWFRRGWTLQELVAPRRVEFYNCDWEKLCDRADHTSELEAITGIDASILGGASMRTVSIGRRMSWAAGRDTTRVEDMAYSLLGIFDINMPLLYGEGTKAFVRLQEEILQKHDDDTLLAWCANDRETAQYPLRGLLASSPAEFVNFRLRSYYSLRGEQISWEGEYCSISDPESVETEASLSNKGIKITGNFVDVPGQYMTMLLNCGRGYLTTHRLGIYLTKQGLNRYARALPSKLATVITGGPLSDERTVYLPRTAADLQSHFYSEPWIRGSPTLVSRHIGNMGLTASQFAFGFYIERPYAFSELGVYSLIAISLADNRRRHMVQPCQRGSSWDTGFLLKGPNAFRSDGLFASYALVLQSEQSGESVHIFIRSRDPGEIEHKKDEKIIIMQLGLNRPAAEDVSLTLEELRTDEKTQLRKTIELSGGKATLGVRLQLRELRNIHVWDVALLGPTAVDRQDMGTAETVRALKGFFPPS